MEKNKNIFVRIYKCLCRFIIVVGMRIVFRPKVRYIDKAIDKDIRKKPSIIICNHTSLYDALVIYSALNNHNGYILTAKDWAEKKFAGSVIRGNRTILIDRMGLDTGWIRDCKKVIDDGFSVVIFPEGHRSKTDDLLEFKGGFVMLAQMTGAPIIPVCLTGDYHKFIGPRKRILVDIPMQLRKPEAGMNTDYINDECVRFRNHVQNMKVKSESIFGPLK